METISIIIPCYNEEEAIPVYYETMVRQMDEMEEQQKVQFELIFVDDGSKDHSLFEMRRLAQKDMRCRYLSFSRNFGKRGSHVRRTAGGQRRLRNSDGCRPSGSAVPSSEKKCTRCCRAVPVTVWRHAAVRGRARENQILLIKCLLRCDQPPFQNRDRKRCTGLPPDEPQNGGCRAGNE